MLKKTRSHLPGLILLAVLLGGLVLWVGLSSGTENYSEKYNLDSRSVITMIVA